MKWKCPGNECEKEYQELVAKYDDKKLYIYGAGLVGGRIFDALVKCTSYEVKGFLDRDISKTIFRDIKVYHLQDIENIAQQEKNNLILMGLTGKEGNKVKASLTCNFGLDDNKCIAYEDFMMHDLPILLLYGYHKVFLNSISMIVTERCTLRCEDCSIMAPYFTKWNSYETEGLLKEIDRLFEFSDMIGNYTLTGGEPLLNKDLSMVIEYIGTHYRNQIGSFQIITNGMILPDKTLLERMLRYDVAVEISDYTKAVPAIKESVMESLRLFQNAGLKVYFLDSDQWVDFGFKSVVNEFTSKQAEDFFDYCHTKCRAYIGGKIRYCVNAYFAEWAMGIEEDIDNGFDIMHLELNEENKRKLVEYDLGYNGKGYLNMCRRCNGTCEINQHFIVGGVENSAKTVSICCYSCFQWCGLFTRSS